MAKTKTKGKSKGWPKIGSVRKSKSGGFYIKLDDLGEDDTLTLNMDGEERVLVKDDIIQLESPSDEIDRLVEKDVISAEKGEERKAQVPDYIKYRLKVPPAKSE